MVFYKININQGGFQKAKAIMRPRKLSERDVNHFGLKGI